MADSKITALTALTSADPANDMIPIVDVSDTPPASGNTKRISINNILAASGTATLASATITGDLTVDTSTLKVDSTNNRVGIGTASPATRFVVSGGRTGLFSGDAFSLSLAQTSGQANYLYLGTDASGTLLVSESNGNSVMTLSQSGVFTWYDGAGGTRMTLDASGNLMVGVASSSNRLDIQKSTDCAVLVKSTGANTNIAMDYVSNYGNHTIRKSGTAVWDFGVINDSSATPAFKFSNGPSAVGVQLVHGATAWTALSDETVKDIIEPITNAITKVGSLRSVIGKFKTDDASKRRSFLIAQDVFAVLPEAVDVVGEKNELGVRYSDVIPLLVAAIKELSAEVNALKNA